MPKCFFFFFTFSVSSPIFAILFLFFGSYLPNGYEILVHCDFFFFFHDVDFFLNTTIHFPYTPLFLINCFSLWVSLSFPLIRLRLYIPGIGIYLVYIYIYISLYTWHLGFGSLYNGIKFKDVKIKTSSSGLHFERWL